jgi:excisionase family DNA binding protein
MGNFIQLALPIEELTNRIAGAVLDQLRPHLNAPAAPSNEEFLTRKQTADILGVSCPTLLQWTRTGKITGHRIGSRVRYKRSDVDSSLVKIKLGR